MAVWLGVGLENICRWGGVQEGVGVGGEEDRSSGGMGMCRVGLGVIGV